MVTVDLNGRNVVNARPDASESFTIPSGEVWKINVVAPYYSHEWPGSANYNVSVNGQNFIGSTGNSLNGIECVFTGGDKIALNSNGTEKGAFHVSLSGYEVSNVVDNQPVSEQIGSGNGQITVPAGETWNVNIIGTSFSTSFGGTQPSHVAINGDVVMSPNTAEDTEHAKFTLTEGDTIEWVQDQSTNVGCHISGFVL